MKYAIKIPVPDGGWLYVTETKEDGSRDIATYDTYAEAQRDNTLVWNNKGEVVEYNQEVPCKDHPDAPHGFDRNASLSQNRYVCECEYWEPDWEPENPVKEIHDWSELKIESEKVLVEGYDIQNRKELKQLLESMINRMDRIEYGHDDERNH